MRLLSSPKRKLGPRSKITRIMMLVIALFSVWCLGFGFFFVGKAGPSSTSSVPEPSKNTRQLRKSFDNSSVVRVLGKTKEEIADDLVMGAQAGSSELRAVDSTTTPSDILDRLAKD